MPPISAGKCCHFDKRRKYNHHPLVPLDENIGEIKETTYNNNFFLSFGSQSSLENTSKCSTLNIEGKLFTHGSSTRDICISVLRNHGLLLNRKEENNTRISSCPSKMRMLKCKSCAAIGSSTKMLICDNCEGPFHLKCSGMLLRKVLPEEWYCHPCARDKRKRRAQNVSSSNGTLLKTNEKLRRDAIPKYISRVRIGENFQVEVPEWLAPTDDDDGYYEELKEIKPVEFCNLNNNKTRGYCNWIQCREKTKGTICGKWRRAPLFENQTDSWDCSCSVLWDPIHADCAVPQELETSEVMKQLEYVNSLRHRLAHKRESSNSRDIVCNKL